MRTAGEREILEGMLDWYREGIVRKVSCLDPAVAIEETARHLGHLDILVESLAGTVGE